MQEINIFYKIVLVNKMRLDYIINEMLQKIEWANINTYFIDKKGKKRNLNKSAKNRDGGLSNISDTVTTNQL